MRALSHRAASSLPSNDIFLSALKSQSLIPMPSPRSALASSKLPAFRALKKVKTTSIAGVLVDVGKGRRVKRPAGEAYGLAVASSFAAAMVGITPVGDPT